MLNKAFSLKYLPKSLRGYVTDEEDKIIAEWVTIENIKMWGFGDAMIILSGVFEGRVVYGTLTMYQIEQACYGTWKNHLQSLQHSWGVRWYRKPRA